MQQALLADDLSNSETSSYADLESLSTLSSSDSDISDVPTKKITPGFLLAVFLIYAAGDGAWQAIDNLLSNDGSIDSPQALSSWFLRCLLTGSGQAVAAWTMNELLACFHLTDHWQDIDVMTSLATGIMWLPFMQLGQFLGTKMSMSSDLNSTACVVATSLSVAIGNTSTLSILKSLYPPDDPCGKTPSVLADTTSATAFYLQGPLPEPKFLFFQPSAKGERTYPWTVFFSAAGAVIGESAQWVMNKCFRT